MKNILILGAYSAIAQETARCFAKDGCSFFLTGRDSEKLQALSADLILRGALRIQTFSADMNDFGVHGVILEKAQAFLGDLDTVLVAYGTLLDQKLCMVNYAEAEKEIRTNFLSAVSFLIVAAEYFEKKKSGTIAVITSVAGDRSRAGNYTYGTAKGALSLYLQGLRARLAKSGVNVLTIKPGFVDTPMTVSFRKSPLFASAETVGRGIYQAMIKKKDVVYLPWFWRPIMWGIKIIPEFIFKKLPL